VVKNKTLGYRVGNTINYIAVFLLCAMMLYPFWYLLVLSFNDGVDAMKGGLYFWPRKFTLENFKTAFENEEIVDAFIISILRTVIGTVLTLFARAGVAYALSRRRFWGRQALSFFFYFTGLIGGGMIPSYILYRQLGLLNNFWIYILPGMYSFFDMVMLRTYFQGIPDSMEEAACIDGCGSLRTFFQIYIPLSKPILATLALFAAVGHWNDWFVGMFYITDRTLQPAATLLQRLISQVDLTKMSNQQIDAYMQNQPQTTPEALRMTFVIVMTIPILCVYPFLQKYFVKGVMIGAVKA